MRILSLLALPAILLSPGIAQAAEPWPFHHAVSVRYGTVSVDDTYLREVFGKQNDLLKLEYSLGFRIAEFGLSGGFAQDMGYLQTADGDVSDEHDMFTLFPLEAGATVRLDFFDEQWLVPTGRIGGNYWIWRENWYIPEGSVAEKSRTGGKLGWHWGAGGMLRLDAFDRKAASELQATTGIDDTFIMAEYRRSYMPKGEEELHLSGWEITAGLRFDF